MRYIRTRNSGVEKYVAEVSPARIAGSRQLNAIWWAFVQHWKQLWVPGSILGLAVSAAGPGIVVGYIAGQDTNAAATSYAFFGVALSMVWNWGVFRTGWSMANEHAAGTLDLLMTTRTPVALIMLGKALAIMTFSSLSGAVAFFAAVGISRQLPSPEDAVLFLLAGSTALASVIVTCFLFAPFSFLVGVRGGFFNALMPFGCLVSGFLHPVGILPFSLELISRLLPTAWAMQAVVDSIEGEGSRGSILLDLTVAFGLNAALLVLACLLFVKAEQRVRVSGSLGSI